MSKRFFTNEGENTLLKKFAGVFAHNPDIERFDALVGYLRASGYFAQWAHLEKVPLIIVGIDVDSRRDRLVARFAEQMVFKKDVSPLLTDKTFHPSFVLAMLNSQLLSWIYVNTSLIATKDNFRRTRDAEPRTLPIPTAIAAEQATVSGLVNGILTPKRSGDAVTVTASETEIDTRVFRLYALTPADTQLVEGAAK